MLSKERVFTAIAMVVILVPFILLGGYFMYALCAVLAFIGTYELVKMHNRKFNLPKALDIVVPFLSFGMVIVAMFADLKLSIDGFKFIIFGLLLVFLFSCSVPEYQDITSKLSIYERGTDKIREKEEKNNDQRHFLCRHIIHVIRLFSPFQSRSDSSRAVGFRHTFLPLADSRTRADDICLLQKEVTPSQLI